MYMFETIALSVITILLLLLLLTRRPGLVKLVLGALTAASSVAAMVLFLLMQRAAGRPTAGHETFQLYLPCLIYMALFLWGVIAAVLSQHKRRLDRAARTAERTAKHARKEQPTEAHTPAGAGPAPEQSKKQ